MFMLCKVCSARANTAGSIFNKFICTSSQNTQMMSQSVGQSVSQSVGVQTFTPRPVTQKQNTTYIYK